MSTITMNPASVASRIEEDYASGAPYQWEIEALRNSMQKPGTTHAAPIEGALRLGGNDPRPRLAAEVAQRAEIDLFNQGLHGLGCAAFGLNHDATIDHALQHIVLQHEFLTLHPFDLGPEGGAGGGQVVATGTPEQVAQVAESHTGRFLSSLLNGHAHS